MKQILHFIAALPMLLATTTAYAFSTEDVAVQNGEADVTLAGTLTIPNDSKPKAALVLATGSGAQNRDEEVAGHRPFKVIAEFLARHGYAVLRMDDRGTGESTGDFNTAVNSDLTADINAGLHYIADRFPATPAGVLGHSEGGIIAVKNASDPLCKFIITLAAPAWAGDSIVMSQSRALAVSLTGRWDKEADQRRLLDIVKSNLPDVQARMALSFTLNGIYGEAAKLTQTQQLIEKQLAALLSPWYRDFIKYDPASDISAVAIPWLALNGDRDTQVLPGNLTTISELNQQADTRLLAGHNHLFQHCSTGLVTEYAAITDDISEDALSAILDWLDTHVRPQ